MANYRGFNIFNQIKPNQYFGFWWEWKTREQAINLWAWTRATVVDTYNFVLTNAWALLTRWDVTSRDSTKGFRCTESQGSHMLSLPAKNLTQTCPLQHENEIQPTLYKCHEVWWSVHSCPTRALTLFHLVHLNLQPRYCTLLEPLTYILYKTWEKATM